MIEQLRIGNIQLKRASTIPFRDREATKYWEIVCWYPNPHYKKENDYIFDEVKQMYKDPNCNYYIDPNCFKKEECCYTIAIFEEEKDEEPDVVSVGKRPFTLSPKDITDFISVVKYAYEHTEDMYPNLYD